MQAGKCSTVVLHGLLATALAISATPVLAEEAYGGQAGNRSAGQPVTAEAASFPPEKPRARPALPDDIARLTELANSGDGAAQFKLGLMYADGRGVAKDERQAVFWFRKVAEQGYASAQFSLGVMYEDGRGVAKDERQAVVWYRKAADQGDASAQQNLGVMYADGRGVAKDERQAVFWFRKAAEQGDADAQFSLGVRYADGRGVVKDEGQAVSWYHKAAEQGNAMAQFNLGKRYATGRGVAKNDVQAVFWLRKAAEQGDPEAQSVLGNMYFSGQGVTKDYGQALFWYRKAAEQGEARAQYSLGFCYELGLGVRKDLPTAMYWYDLAGKQGEADAVKKLQQLKAAPGFSSDDLDALKAKAQRGDPKAQLELGDRYYAGNGLPRDMDLGNEWHRKALPYLKQQAERGDAESQYKVGNILWHLNRGPAPEVWPWYQRAAAQGHVKAIRALSEMPGANRSEQPHILETKSLIDFLPPPPDATDLSRKFCRNEPARMTDRSFERKLLSSGALEILGDWARKHYAPGRTRQDCPKINQYNTLIAWNYTLGTGNYSGTWTNEDVDRFIAERQKAELAMQNNKQSRQLPGNVMPSSVDPSVELRASIGRFPGSVTPSIGDWSISRIVAALKAAAERGDPEGQYKYAFLFESGVGVPKDFQKSLYWRKKAADQGHASAQSSLGTTYYYGYKEQGLEKNRPEALIWYGKGAHGGDDHAQYMYGVMLAEGDSIKQDLRKAVYWWEKAAALGHNDAAARLQKLRAEGRGNLLTPTLTSRDFESLQKLAQQGDPEAQKKLGDMLKLGKGVTRDRESGVYWLRKALPYYISKANQGEAKYQYAAVLISNPRKAAVGVGWRTRIGRLGR